ncbi:GNAT family N-acetyltransferase [Pseudomonas sp. NFACC45]|uniref:GNAT family N-acetyltransferase n=1 Tax=Pseudomonas sp. NFACC45 TaxID=1566201 RepID=UPI0008F24FE7|nr:GNAT family protein [Pseudomonas sp. NFACC45]SFG85965.1 Protein N-acetyltransferase, RimJ/RimL family [Pseudomonas sp. NFACC45]
MNITLRTFQASDFDTVISWIDGPQTLSLWAGATFTYPLDKEQLERYLAKAQERYPWRFLYAVVDQDEKLIGHIEFSDIWPHLSLRFARILIGDPESRGKGYGQAILRQALALAYTRFNVARVDLGVKKENLLAINCYRKAGFKDIGLWPQAIETPIGWIDVHWMTHTREEQCP